LYPAIPDPPVSVEADQDKLTWLELIADAVTPVGTDGGVISGVEIVAAGASSKLALTWLSEGKVHIAGSHLEDPKTGEFNLPFNRKEFPGEYFSVCTFSRWEEGLILASGNPRGVRKIEDLARKGVKFVNREPGSGSRALLDKLLEKIGMEAKKIEGYTRIAYGHLAAAYCVTVHSAQFGAHMPRRSPRTSPSLKRPAAKASTRLASSV